jgi:hypothetical protein
MLGRPTLRRRGMFLMLCDGRERKQNANRKKSEYDFHAFNPPPFESAKCSESG